MNAFRQVGYQRLRSGLLAAGMAITMVVGPLHAAATHAQLFIVADMLNILSLVLLTGGVIYRLDTEKAGRDRLAAAPVRAA